MLDMRCRALFYLWKVPHGNAVLVVDRDGPVSVTNDAENVVGYVLCGHPNKPRILYKDTDGEWDELLHDGEKFTGFALLTPAQRNDFFNEYSSGTTP
jgi:hypothetical protein